MADWAKFLQMHIDGLNGKSTKMLKAESFNKLHESYPGQEYTYGAWIRAERSWGGTVYNHTGSNNYNFVNVWLAPQKDLIVLVRHKLRRRDCFRCNGRSHWCFD